MRSRSRPPYKFTWFAATSFSRFFGLSIAPFIRQCTAKQPSQETITPQFTRSRRMVVLWMAVICLMPATSAPAQLANDRASRVLAEPPSQPPQLANSAAVEDQPSINVLELIWSARWLMIPIILMSVVVVAVGMERAIALRRHQVSPPELVAEINAIRTTEFVPRRLAEACINHPSTLATVTQEILRKVGRPQAEIESAAATVMQRESERLYRNVRTLNLAAAITPLMGLLGTVWGMIEAFFATANLPVGANKAESLAEGIYFALVTTAGGLMVAIPAAMLAHWLEGRIQKLLLDMEELLSRRLLVQTARMEGRTAGHSRSSDLPPIAPPRTSSTPSTPPSRPTVVK